MDDIGTLCNLDDPNRRALYEYVAAAREPVTRDQASAALAIDRSLAAYHLDKLVEGGLLAASFARPDGRSGPGAGRPAKRYERADREFSVSVPPRDYRLAAELFVRAMETAASGKVRRSLHRAATAMGRGLVASEGARVDLAELLRGQGFEPYDDDGVIRLRNCPFRELVRQHTELVCGMNLALLTGVVKALDTDVNARPDPAPGRCCVRLDPT